MDEDVHTEDELTNSLQDLLRGINSTATREPSHGSPWATRAQLGESAIASSSRSSLPLPSAPGSSRSTPRLNNAPTVRTASSQRIDTVNGFDLSSAASQVSPPARSIFVSGPPTSSISANTAHASISTTSASGNSLPLSALTGSSFNRRCSQRPPELNLLPASIAIRGTEKDVDDLDNTAIPDSIDTDVPLTSHKLSNLFVSDTPSTHLRSYSNLRSPTPDSSTLLGHLLYNGFLGGRHSDITVHAFGQSYKLHKLLLDRAPYFSSAFCGPWTESSAHEMTILPQEIDTNITQTAFELALKRLYGTAAIAEEERDAVGLFATACWLDMPDLVDQCVDYILRQMHTAKLHELIKLVTNSYYGRPGDRILASAKAMLCREGWEMAYEHWDYIPAEIIREIIGGDPFYVPGEWERWFLAMKILNRRLRRLAIGAKLVDEDGTFMYPTPQSLRFFAIRFDTTYRRESGFGTQKHWSDNDDAWCSLYTSPEVSPLLVLLDEGIHYIHLRFEQLQHIRSSRDILGVPILPDKVVSDALWMQMELRQRILNAHEGDLELGFSEIAEEQEEQEEQGEPEPDPVTTSADPVRGKQREDAPQASSTPSAFDMDSGSWDGNGLRRKFWIPTTDISCIVGGARDAVASPAATSSGDWLSSATRLSASLEPSDVAWAVDFAGSVFDSSTGSRNIASTSPPRYSHYPPFRFSAEFPNPRTLKEKKRVYSQTVWYAGSMWNLYIQRVNTSKGQQLGIYLHRAKEKDPTDDPLAQFVPSSVDDRIGQLEREMLLRKTNVRPTSWHEDADEPLSSAHEFDGNTSTLLSPSRSTSHRDREGNHKTSQHLSRSRKLQPPYHLHRHTSADISDKMMMPDSPGIDAALIRANQYLVSSIFTMPPYTDTRSTIKTYFKIYSPSKAGRSLSVYESAPDSFNFGKSWGWKSSQLVLDDGVGYESGSMSKAPTVSLSSKEGKLRYMVVIGNV